MSTNTTIRWRPFVAVSLLPALALTACGSDDPPEVAASIAEGDEPVEAAEADLPAEVATASDVMAVAVDLVDYGYEGLPAQVGPGTSFALTNTSDVELHELVAVRLPDDEERAASELVALPPEELAAYFPLVTDVVLAPPGATPDLAIPVVGDGVLDEPGRYLLLCAIPTGADPVEYLTAAAESEGPPQVDGGPPHLAQGMWAELVVG